jgi:hypothetical protein
MRMHPELGWGLDQWGFARAGGPHDPDSLRTPHLKEDLVQGRSRVLGTRITVEQVVYGDMGFNPVAV